MVQKSYEPNGEALFRVIDISVGCPPGTWVSPESQTYVLFVQQHITRNKIPCKLVAPDRKKKTLPHRLTGIYVMYSRQTIQTYVSACNTSQGI